MDFVADQHHRDVCQFNLHRGPDRLLDGTPPQQGYFRRFDYDLVLDWNRASIARYVFAVLHSRRRFPVWKLVGTGKSRWVGSNSNHVRPIDGRTGLQRHACHLSVLAASFCIALEINGSTLGQG